MLPLGYRCCRGHESERLLVELYCILAKQRSKLLSVCVSFCMQSIMENDSRVGWRRWAGGVAGAVAPRIVYAWRAIACPDVLPCFCDNSHCEIPLHSVLVHKSLPVVHQNHGDTVRSYITKTRRPLMTQSLIPCLTRTSKPAQTPTFRASQQRP